MRKISQQLPSTSSAAVSFSCNKVNRPDHGERSMIVDQRKTNAIIENSSFPQAFVAPRLEKQSTVTYKDCTIICQSAHRDSFISQPSHESGQSSRRDSLAFAEEASRRDYDCRPPEHVSMQYPPDSQMSFSQNSEGAASRPDYTKVSEKIRFYNVEPLRPGSRIYKGKQKHAVDIFRDVAVKLLPYRKENLHEIKILLELAEHMNIVNIIESDVIFGHVREIYIAMELCSQNLREYVCENENVTQNFERNSSYSKQLMTGLDFIHLNNVIHTDLKPENILFSLSRNVIKLSDFGMSKYSCRDGSTHRPSTVVGSDGFQAPEMYCIPPKLSKASDVFSMGLITFYLLTNGKHPFGDSPHDWSYLIRHCKKKDLTLLQDLNALSYKKSHLLNIISAVLHEVADARPTTQEILRSPFYEGASCRVDNCPSEETFPKSVRPSHCVEEFSTAVTTSIQAFQFRALRTSSPESVEPIAYDSPAECNSPVMTDEMDEVPQSSNQALFSQPISPSQGLGLFSPSALSSGIKKFDVKSPFQGWLTHNDLCSRPSSVASTLFSHHVHSPIGLIVSDELRPATTQSFQQQQRPCSPIWISSDEEDGIEECNEPH